MNAKNINLFKNPKKDNLICKKNLLNKLYRFGDNRYSDVVKIKT